MDLRSRYAAALTDKSFYADEAQLQALDALQRLAVDLAGRRPPGLWQRLSRRLGSAPPRPVRGVYLWGGVGRGKTFLMDLFCDSLPFSDRLRYHFHRLMYRVHGRLRALRHEESPLDIVAAELAAQARVICFDEFYVSDIADAMILGNLLDGLLRRGVALVATSNIPPDELYLNGLQRQRFLPTIDLIKAHTEVLEVDGGTDYRLRVLERARIFSDSSAADADELLAGWFDALAPGPGTTGLTIEVNGRDIPTVRRADGVAWFDFQALCGGPRSQDDYIEIARAFGAVILAKVPVLDEFHENEARRFIALVDEFYDRRVKLVMSAAQPVDRLYLGRRLVREFERTRSRLLEMQSHRYLAAAHLP